MPVTYTDNLQLGLQETKSDTLDWDVLTDNWLKIDAAFSKAVPAPAAIDISLKGADSAIAGIPVSSDKWEYVQENADVDKASSTLTITANAPCLLIFAVMHRPDVSINGDGWTKVVESAAIDSTNINQRITVWAKSVQAGEYTDTVFCSQTGRITAKMICLYGAASLTVSGNTLIDSVPYTPPVKSGKRRLYLLSSAYANTSGTPMAVTVSNTGALDLKSAEELRFSVFYDYQPTISTVPEFSYFDASDYTSDYMNELALDITEV